MTENKFLPGSQNPIKISQDALARLGAPKVVYIRPLHLEELTDAERDELQEFPANAELFSVHAADGTPMAIVDGRDTAFAAARQYELEPVSVH